MKKLTTKIKSTIAALTTAALVVTGTFALNQAINKTNEFIGEKEGSTLHDDFDPGTGQKDVYVENTGASVLFVRVKLRESMNLTSYTWRPQDGDWVTHTCGEYTEDCEHANGVGKLFHDYFTWKMGGWKYYMSSNGSPQVVQDTAEYTEEQYLDPNSGVKKTPDAQIISAADFLTLSPEQQNTFTGWIYSTDGYVYW